MWPIARLLGLRKDAPVEERKLLESWEADEEERAEERRIRCGFPRGNGVDEFPCGAAARNAAEMPLVPFPGSRGGDGGRQRTGCGGHRPVAVEGFEALHGICHEESSRGAGAAGLVRTLRLSSTSR